MIATILVTAVVATGCATKEQVAAIRAEQRKSVAQEMMTVQKHVTAAHLEQCKRIVESKVGIYGQSWKLAGPLQPHMGATCEVYRNSIIEAPSGVQFLAYLAPVQMVGGVEPIFKTKGPPLLGCVTALKDGKIEVRDSVPTGAPKASFCHRM